MNTWKILTMGVVIGLLAAGLILLVSRGRYYSPFELQPIPTAVPIAVHIAGGVKSPGVYRIPANSRVIDAVDAAGGFSEEADREALNLSQLVSDGQKVQIPLLGEDVTTNQSDQGTLNKTQVQDHRELVNINTAGKDILSTLPGIGPVTAQNILDYRLAHGTFSSIDDLLKVKGIGESTFEDIRGLISTR